MSQPDIKIGHNVFLKKDISKMRARELYRVTDTFTEDNEQWATIQKHNSQFRMKKYKVKISELMLLPGQELSIETTIQESDSTDAIKPIREQQLDERHYSRPLRKAALQARKKIAQLNMVNKPKKTETLTHGWDYQKMLELFMFDDEETYYIEEDVQPIQDYLHTEHSITSSRSPSTDISDEPEDTGINPLHNDCAPPTPAIVPTLPIDLTLCQDLTDQLNLPEVVAAAKSDHHSTRNRSSSRNRTKNPSNYKLFDRTGRR